MDGWLVMECGWGHSRQSHQSVTYLTCVGGVAGRRLFKARQSYPYPVVACALLTFRDFPRPCSPFFTFLTQLLLTLAAKFDYHFTVALRQSQLIASDPLNH